MGMDGSITFSPTAISITFLLLSHVSIISANGIFKVEHKFAGRERSLKALTEHDSRRHGRMLSTMDLPLGGIGDPAKDGLYYTKVSIGTPAKDFYVQVDTGSDILWVNCAGCENCPKNSTFGMDLILYDLKASSTGKEVGCDQEFCSLAYHGAYPGDCKGNDICEYTIEYGDGSATRGHFVNDYLQYKQESDNPQSSSANSSFSFGCSTKQSDDLGSSQGALDGIIGFGQSNSSMISQLASAGKVKKVFSHCLDGINGGGIFAIGEVIEPKVKTTSLVPDMMHYNVNLTEIKVGDTPLKIPSSVFENGDKKGTVIDSGTTLAYLPIVVYLPLISAIQASQPELILETRDEQFTCFETINTTMDDMFPTVTFTFEGSLTLTVYPHEYIFKPNEPKNQWCFGWVKALPQNELIILGDTVLSNRLVVYDLENQVIGWAEHNCSSSIKLQDGNSGPTHEVGYHDLRSTSSGGDIGSIFTLVLLSFMFQKLLF